MNLAKNIITGILALLLANPACCCALKNHTPSNEAPIRSCCSEPASPNQEKNAPSNKHECPCSINKQYTEQGQCTFSAPDIPLLPVNPIAFVEVTPLMPIFSVEARLPKRPPPGQPLRVLYSVFRL